MKHNISGAPVIAADDELVGVVSQSDVVRFDTKKPDEQDVTKIVEYYCGFVNRPLDKEEVSNIQDKAIDYMTVHSIMTTDVVCIEQTMSVEEALLLMKGNDIHRLLITKGGILVGVVTAMDILKFVSE